MPKKNNGTKTAERKPKPATARTLTAAPAALSGPVNGGGGNRAAALMAAPAEQLSGPINGGGGDTL